MHIKIGQQIINTEAIAYAQIHEAGDSMPGNYATEELMPGGNEYEERVVELRLGASEVMLTTRLYGEEADLFLAAWPFYELDEED